jgi:hypothetical protein
MRQGSVQLRSEGRAVEVFGDVLSKHMSLESMQVHPTRVSGSPVTSVAM